MTRIIDMFTRRPLGAEPSAPVEVPVPSPTVPEVDQGQEFLIPLHGAAMLRDWYTGLDEMGLVGQVNDAILETLQQGTGYCRLPISFKADYPTGTQLLQAASGRFQAEMAEVRQE